ncbi:MAG: type II secretion system protein [Sedimentisphaerales bacterium]|nr:type II secretion system protein [Sedimentisphaerales bacterium]
MRRKLTKPFKTEIPPVKKAGGFTLTEVVVASALLIIAIVPILKALTGAQVTSTVIENRTRSLTLAQARLDEIKARSVYNYGDTFTQTNTPIEGFYLCNVEDTSVNANLRQIKVSVGKDNNTNSILETDEIEIILATLIARRW